MTDPVKVGGPYVESKDHQPDATDMVAQFNTSGVGAHHRIEEVSPIFEVDKVATSQEILAAVDPKNHDVPGDRVQYPNPLEDNETAKKNLVAVAKARVGDGVEVGGPTPAMREAEEEGEAGRRAAVSQEQGNAVVGSTSHAGSHDEPVVKDDGKSGDSGGSKSGGKSESKSGGSGGKSGDDKSATTSKSK